MTSGGAPGEIGIVLYPGVQIAAVLGLTDLFSIANTLAEEALPGTRPALRVTHWGSGDSGASDIMCVYQSEPSVDPRPNVLVLPPTLVSLPDPKTCISIAHWLKRQHAQGVQLVSVCSGAFLIAETGLLDGRTVSTHRRCARALVESFPKVVVDPEARIVDHVDILTAGGFMAWVDVGLILVDRLLGESVRAETARFVRFEVLPTNSPPYLARFPSWHSHSDMAVRAAQEFIHIRDGQDISLFSLAAAAQLGRRTLLRRFLTATGLTPIEYCRAVRLARARELLESGVSPKEVAESLGYAGVSSFARAFHRAYGIAPAAFQKRAQVRAGEERSSLINETI